MANDLKSESGGNIKYSAGSSKGGTYDDMVRDSDFKLSSAKKRDSVDGRSSSIKLVSEPKISEKNSVNKLEETASIDQI